jgi:hypothetical protein
MQEDITKFYEKIIKPLGLELEKLYKVSKKLLKL